MVYVLSYFFQGLDIKKMISSTNYDEKINTYKVKCGGDLEMWESSGWIKEIGKFTLCCQNSPLGVLVVLPGGQFLLKSKPSFFALQIHMDGLCGTAGFI